MNGHHKLDGVHPSLVKRVELAARIGSQPFMVLEGVRSEARQKELYAQGRTKPGKIVTWTLNSKHKKQADGYGHAVDLGPDPMDWNTIAKFDAIADAMFAADKTIDDGLTIRWGYNWDGDSRPREKGESDGPHFELKRISADAHVIANTFPRIMRLGDTGEDVKALQKTLADKRYNIGALDGVFGPKTDRAVRALQKATGLVVDGLVGKQTLKTLSLIP